MFLAIVSHLWEKGCIPGGFTDLITAKLNFTQSNPHSGEFVTVSCALLLTFLPLLFPPVAFLAMAPMIPGVLEGIVHVAAIKLFRLPRPYSSGMFTAVLLTFPLAFMASGMPFPMASWSRWSGCIRFCTWRAA